MHDCATVPTPHHTTPQGRANAALVLLRVPDVEGKGFIEVTELLRQVDAASGDFVEVAQFMEDLVAELDTVGDGTISRSEKLRRLRGHVDWQLPLCSCCVCGVTATQNGFCVCAGATATLV